MTLRYQRVAIVDRFRFLIQSCWLSCMLLGSGCFTDSNQSENKLTRAPLEGIESPSDGQVPVDVASESVKLASAAPVSRSNGGVGDNGESEAVQTPVAIDKSDTGSHTNRLVTESSPYLKLHAHNPVDWYPWSEEALAKAKRENKVIFLSVGYSSCYWCHVMERESFMDEQIAVFMNEHFVCIKVDREERPDVDAIYMTAVQLLTRRGGWPMSVFLTPDAEPFFGGTYFPARDGDRPGARGFYTIVQQIHRAWQNDFQGIQDSAGKITAAIREHMQGRPAEHVSELDSDLCKKVFESLADSFDAQHGGFGFSPNDPGRPKFPEPSNLFFLLDWLEHGDEDKDKTEQMFLHTLERMEMGGIWDHLGGGFHRYSTDRHWHIPHFEKMLYDNGQLASVYAEAYALTGREDFRHTVRNLIAFVLREMRSPEGAFYAALDAESEKIEGKFYRWQPDEIKAVLDDSQYNLLSSLYGFDSPPNFEEYYHVPLLRSPIQVLAVRRNTDIDSLESQLDPIRKKLLAVRGKRARPLTDTKVLTSWNGLMIRGLADAGRVLEQPAYTQAAVSAADFILTNVRQPDGRLYRTYTDGEAKLNAYLDDYAFFVEGMIAIHRATGDRRWLDWARELTDLQLEFFWDKKDGAFFYTSADHESLIVRGKQFIDGAQPAGNSVTVENLLYLAEAFDDPLYRDRAQKTALTYSSLLAQSPAAAPRLVKSIRRLTTP